MNPYTLRHELLSITRRIEDGEELTPELLSEINALDTEFETQVQNLCKLIAGENMSANALRSEASRMVERAGNHEDAAARLKQSLHDLLRLRDTDRVRTDLFVVGIHKNPPSARLREGIKVEDLPPEYVRITETANLQKVLEDHRHGRPLPDEFEVVTTNTHIKIRPR